MGRKLNAVKALEKDIIGFEDLIKALINLYNKGDKVTKIYLRDYIRFLKVQQAIIKRGKEL